MATDEYPDIPQDVRDNYAALCAERGWSMQTAADTYEDRDPRLAAYLRSQASGDEVTSAPKGRRSKLAATAAASDDETATA